MDALHCVPALRALGEETRLRMVQLLAERQLSVNDIAEKMGVTQYNVSRHLKVLREAGLLEIEKQGQQRLYRIPEALRKNIPSSTCCVLDLGCCTFQLEPARQNAKRSKAAS